MWSPGETMLFIFGNKQLTLAFVCVFGSVLLKNGKGAIGQGIGLETGNLGSALLAETLSPYVPQVAFGANSLCSISVHTKPSASGDWAV